jgi:hypothetical protein
MNDTTPIHDRHRDAARLRTHFVSAEHTTELMQVLELALEDLDQVAGGREKSCGGDCAILTSGR